jgi:hypothetical protein
MEGSESGWSFVEDNTENASHETDTDQTENDSIAVDTNTEEELRKGLHEIVSQHTAENTTKNNPEKTTKMETSVKNQEQKSTMVHSNTGKKSSAAGFLSSAIEAAGPAAVLPTRIEKVEKPKP